MTATLEGMPKPKKAPTESVRVAKEVARMAATVAGHRGVSMPDYLNEVLMPHVLKDYQEVSRLIAEETGKPRPKPKP